MKIAIIDDSMYKIDQIKDCLSKIFPEPTMLIARSFQTGLSLMQSSAVDLLILDMTLPNYERDDGAPEGDVRVFGGRELLEELSFYDIHCKVIVVTQFDRFGEGSEAIEFSHLLKVMQKESPDRVLGGLYYSSIDNRWRGKLRTLVGNKF